MHSQRYLSKKHILFLIAGCLVLVLSVSSIVLNVRAEAAVDITGYAWSETIGWVSLSCSNDTDTTLGSTKTVALYSGSGAWTVPNDWNDDANSVECTGAGASGTGASTDNNGSGYGGGGGAYAKSVNLDLTPGESISYQVGIGGAATVAGDYTNNAGGDTWFNSSAFPNSGAACGARGGQGGWRITSGGSAGNSYAVGPGALKYSGGNGGGGIVSGSAHDGGGGGGAATASGNGSHGESANNDGTVKRGGSVGGGNGGLWGARNPQSGQTYGAGGGAGGDNSVDSGAQGGAAGGDGLIYITYTPIIEQSGCTNSNYGLTINEDLTLSGEGWSENIGWLSANQSDLDGCPAGECVARLNDGVLEGWLRAVGANGNGWDGWISLSGPDYGVDISGDGSLSGYAWGDSVVGWLDFSYASIDYAPCEIDGQLIESGNTITAYASSSVPYDESCVSETRTCVDGELSGSYGYPTCTADIPVGTLRATPPIVRSGETTTIRWSSTGADSCTVTGNGDSWSGTSGDETTSQIRGQVIYTLNCDGGGTSMEPVTTTIRLVPMFQET